MKNKIVILTAFTFLTACGNSSNITSDCTAEITTSNETATSTSEASNEKKTESETSGSSTTTITTTVTTTTEPVITTFEMVTEEPQTEASLSLSDQVIGRWQEYKFVDPNQGRSYENGWIYDFKLDGTVDVIANGNTVTGSSWRISGLGVVINNIAWYGLDYDVSINNGEMTMYNAEYGLTFYCKKV